MISGCRNVRFTEFEISLANSKSMRAADLNFDEIKSVSNSLKECPAVFSEVHCLSKEGATLEEHAR